MLMLMNIDRAHSPRRGAGPLPPQTVVELGSWGGDVRVRDVDVTSVIGVSCGCLAMCIEG